MPQHILTTVRPSVFRSTPLHRASFKTINPQYLKDSSRVRKNKLLHRQHSGSFFLLQLVVTNHSLAPSNPPSQAARVSGGGLGRAVGPCTSRGRWANKRAIQRNWKGSQKNKRWKRFSHWAGTSVSQPREGVGTGGSQQRLPVSGSAGASPAAWEHAPSSVVCLLFGEPFFATFSESKMHAQRWNVRLPAAGLIRGIPHSGCTHGKALGHFAPQEAEQPHRLKNNLLSLIVIHWYRTFHPRGSKKQFKISKQFSEWNSLSLRAHTTVALECAWVSVAQRSCATLSIQLTTPPWHTREKKGWQRAN